MNLVLIETFLELVKYGSFSVASQKMFVPQPTLTHRMKQLEESIGDKLIHRDHKGVTLTEAGKMFIPYAVQILEGFNKGKERLERAKNGYTGTLHIGASLALSQYVLPELLEKFTRQHKNVSIHINAHPSDMIIQKLRDNHFHIGLTRYAVHDEDILFEPIHEDPVLLITSPHHPFISRESITTSEVCTEPLILYREGTYFRNFIEFALMNQNVQIKSSYEMNHAELIKSLVKLELGITFLPKLYVKKELESGELVSVPIADKVLPPRYTYIAYNRRYVDSVSHIFSTFTRSFFEHY